MPNPDLVQHTESVAKLSQFILSTRQYVALIRPLQHSSANANERADCFFLYSTIQTRSHYSIFIRLTSYCTNKPGLNFFRINLNLHSTFIVKKSRSLTVL